MFNKAITSLVVCLLATAGFAWLINNAITPAEASGSESVEKASLVPSFTKSIQAPKTTAKAVNAYPIRTDSVNSRVRLRATADGLN